MLEGDIVQDDAISKIIDFWCEARADWFSHDPDFDAAFRERFAEPCQAACEGRLNHGAEIALGASALLILLDQYPRNVFRGSTDTCVIDRQFGHFAHRHESRGHPSLLEEGQQVAEPVKVRIRIL